MITTKQAAWFAGGSVVLLVGVVVAGTGVDRDGDAKPRVTPPAASTSSSTPTPPPAPTLPPSSPTPRPTLTPRPSLPPKPAPPALVALVDRLRVAEEETGGYQREEFGSRAPTQATRQRLLDGEQRRDGTWYSKWDGKVWSDPSRLDADHTVALAEAWSSGAMHWSYEKRVRFANDLTSPFTLNLITDTLNQQVKSDKDPFDWMPAVNRCQYVREWVSVKLAWNLAADPEEKMALHFRAEECDAA